MKRVFSLVLGLGVALAVGTSNAIADTTIYQIQNGAVPPSTLVTCDGVVVTAVFFQGFFAQEPDADGVLGRRRSGIWCFTQSAPSVAVGNLINLTGTYMEFFDESEIDCRASAGGSVTVVGSTSLPPIQNRLITEVNDASATGEEWEGVLCEVTQAGMVSTDTLRAGCASASMTRWGVFRTAAPADTLFVRNSVSTHEIPTPGSPITFLRGPMSFYQCHRNIIPRSNNDVGYIAPPNIVWAYSTGTTTCDIEFSRDVTEASAEMASHYFFLSGIPVTAAVRDDADHTLVHLTTGAQPNGVVDELFAFGIQSEGGGTMPSAQSFRFATGITSIFTIQFVDDPGVDDTSEYLNEVVTVRGKATSTNISAGTTDFFLADATGPWNGIRVEFVGDLVRIGDVVEVSGRISETFGRTRFAFAGFGRAKKLGPGVPLAPTTITSPALLSYNDADESEPYESVLVHVESAEADTVPGGWPFGEYYLVPQTPAPGDTAMMDVDEPGVSDLYFTYVPDVGDQLEITGNVYFSFGAYRIVPRTDGDIEVDGLAVGAVDAPVVAGLSNHPNPFNPTTTISFRLSERTRVRLEVFEASGRVVRRVLDGVPLEAGAHAIAWDGRDDAGLPVASGTYFYRVVSADVSVTRPMTLLK
jgi:hypothetical protein